LHCLILFGRKLKVNSPDLRRPENIFTGFFLRCRFLTVRDCRRCRSDANKGEVQEEDTAKGGGPGDIWQSHRNTSWSCSWRNFYHNDSTTDSFQPPEKAAIVATAFDTRVAAGFVASSGAGGVKLHRHIFGELLENVAGRGEYHWMAGNYLKYAAQAATFGEKTAADLPVDQHQLVALCAPRPCFFGAQIWVSTPAMHCILKKCSGVTIRRCLSFILDVECSVTFVRKQHEATIVVRRAGVWRRTGSRRRTYQAG